MKTFIEFYFPGICLGGKCEREVKSRDIEEVVFKLPQYAISFRFFNKDSTNKKINYSPYYFVGVDYSHQDFIQKYPQLYNCEDLQKAERVIKTNNNSFYPLKSEDIVVVL